MVAVEGDDEGDVWLAIAAGGGGVGEFVVEGGTATVVEFRGEKGGEGRFAAAGDAGDCDQETLRGVELGVQGWCELEEGKATGLAQRRTPCLLRQTNYFGIHRC